MKGMKGIKAHIWVFETKQNLRWTRKKKKYSWMSAQFLLGWAPVWIQSIYEKKFPGQAPISTQGVDGVQDKESMWIQ